MPSQEEIHKAALKAMELTDYCTKHSLYHGQKYKSCTPQKRVMVELAPTKQRKGKGQ